MDGLGRCSAIQGDVTGELSYRNCPVSIAVEQDGLGRCSAIQGDVTGELSYRNCPVEL